MRKITILISLYFLPVSLLAQTGNVGIGTNSPQRKLHVIRGGAIGGIYHTDASFILESNSHNYLQLSNLVGLTSGILSGTNLTAQRSGIKFDPDSAIIFSSGGSVNRMMLDNTGFLGLNVFPPATRLHVSNGSSGNTNTSSSRIATFEDNSSSYIQLLNPNASESGILAGNVSTLIKSGIIFAADSSVRFSTGAISNRMVLDNQGYLGINTLDPLTRLHVSNGSSGNTTTASSRIATFEDNSSSYIQLLNPNASESGILAGNAVALIKSGIVFTADSSMHLRTGGNNTRIRVDNDGSIIFLGPTTLPSSGITPPITGNGNRIMWWADRAALRIGGLSSPVWPESSLGKWSFSCGFNTFALKDYAVAFGKNTDALGDASLVMGDNTNATGNNAFAGGDRSAASGDNSIAFGYTAKASGDNCISVGSETVASGQYSAAFGRRDTASGFCSGGFGLANNAKGDLSFTIGCGLVAKPFGTFVVGSYNEINNSSSTAPSVFAPVFVVGTGDDDNSRENGMEVYRGGTVILNTLVVNTEVNSGLKPGIDDNYKLGTSSRRWKEVWSANPFLQSSDARLKSNIKPLKYGLQTVLAMKPVSYSMKTNLTSSELGFIAQDMETLVPEAVVSPEDGGMKAMKYTNLIPVLTQAIKDQQEIIEKLEKRINELEKKLK